MRPGSAGGGRAHARHRYHPAAPANGRGRQGNNAPLHRGGRHHARRLLLPTQRRPSSGQALSAAAHADLRRQYDLALGDGCGGRALMGRVVGRGGRPRRARRAAPAVAEETAAEHGKTVSRADWRMVMPIHLADSKKEALDDIREGGNSWIQDYFIDTLGAKIQFEEYPGQPREELTVDRMVARGGAIVGTPDDAIARIREVQEASGGFGGVLGLAHEWAWREKRLGS